MTTRIHAIAPITLDALSALDLRNEAKRLDGLELAEARAYRALASKSDGTPEAQALDILHLPCAGRIGISWGSDALWADIGAEESVEELVEMFLSRGEEYEARA